MRRLIRFAIWRRYTSTTGCHSAYVKRALPVISIPGSRSIVLAGLEVPAIFLRSLSRLLSTNFKYLPSYSPPKENMPHNWMDVELGESANRKDEVKALDEKSTHNCYGFLSLCILGAGLRALKSGQIISVSGNRESRLLAISGEHLPMFDGLSPKVRYKWAKISAHYMPSGTGGAAEPGREHAAKSVSAGAEPHSESFVRLNSVPCCGPLLPLNKSVWLDLAAGFSFRSCSSRVSGASTCSVS